MFLSLLAKFKRVCTRYNCIIRTYDIIRVVWHILNVLFNFIFIWSDTTEFSCPAYCMDFLWYHNQCCVFFLASLFPCLERRKVKWTFERPASFVAPALYYSNFKNYWRYMLLFRLSKCRNWSNGTAANKLKRNVGSLLRVLVESPPPSPNRKLFCYVRELQEVTAQFNNSRGSWNHWKERRSGVAVFL
jgi:hypothetical protein